MAQRGVPGPAGTSCLTCKRRHKKCDQRRPICTRCEEGGFECLGYSHHKSAPRSAPPRPARLRAIKPATKQRENEASQSVVCQPVAVKEQTCTRNDGDSTDQSSSMGVSVEATNTPISNSRSLSSFDISCVSRTTSPKRDHARILVAGDHPSPIGTGHSNIPSSLPTLQRLLTTLFQIPPLPPNPLTTLLSSPHFGDYLLIHLERMLNYAYFKPIRDQKSRILEAVASRVRSSWIARWIVLLDARICESLIEDTLQPQRYAHWIRDLEVSVKSTLSQDSTSQEAHHLQSDWLELLVMKAIVVPSSNAIQVLRGATPTFLQNAYSCPELWSGNSDMTGIPLSSIIASNRHDLATFVLVDCMCAMVFGVPQQIEYDTTIGSLSDKPQPAEWAHSAPGEFLILLAEINACRDKRPGTRGWEEIEHQLVTWLPRPTQHDETWESWMVVAWLAMQESWRLTLLAYLYLAVCGASSDEPRVQLCASQILQVVSTVRKHDSPDVNIPFFMQYLMVGICASHEKHRRVVRTRLSNASETKFWKIRSTDFVPVLDHLWHGVGSGGRSVKWDDYIRSREAFVPLVADPS